MPRKIILPLILFCLMLPLVLSAEEAPRLPEGSLRPLAVTLPRGRKYEVFTGPGRQYEKSGRVSTNGWVQVFGWREGPVEWQELISGTQLRVDSTWLLIQYGLDDTRLRFGWIETDNAFRNMEGMESADEALPLSKIMVCRERADLTDDPLGRQNVLLILPSGTQVRVMARMGVWAYVETDCGGKLMCGFVPGAALSGAAWRDETRPFDLRAVSYAPMIQDYAQTREQYMREEDGEPQRREFNTWLRLDSTESRAALETLSDFRVVKGRAVCARLPVPLIVWSDGLDGETAEEEDGIGPGRLHFLKKTGFNRAALDLRLEEGEEIGSLTIACTRTRQDGTQETITLPLAGLRMDMGYPEGGAAFEAKTCAPFRYIPDRQFGGSAGGKPLTLGSLLKEWLYQPMPELPKALADLPNDAGRFSLYLIEGSIQKQPGDFGVYDVTFALENAPAGLYLAAYEECGSCDEIDAFDMAGGDVLLPHGLWEGRDWYASRLEETVSRDFHVLLLADSSLYTASQLEQLLPGLQIRASFSAEKWNMSYEQHGITTAIGPRSSELIQMRHIAMKEEELNALP